MVADLKKPVIGLLKWGVDLPFSVINLARGLVVKHNLRLDSLLFDHFSEHETTFQ